MTGPLDFFTTFKSGERVAPCFGAPASLAAWAARASGVQLRPVITAAAPITPLRMINDRRSIEAETASLCGRALLLLIGSSDFMILSFFFKCFVTRLRSKLRH